MIIFIISRQDYIINLNNERKREQSHKPHAPPLLDDATYSEWQGLH